MNKRKYAGTWTAIITPFKENGDVDEGALRELIRSQIENGVTGVVPMGTTGESPSTTAGEDARLFKIVVEEANGDVMVMAGTGSNCTREAVEHTEKAMKAGVDCCLVVSPYYNKPTPEGLKLHYKAIADVGLPVIVYNVKGRTGINIDTDTLMAIAEHKNIVGVKEASGNLDQMKEVIERRPDDFTVLSGDDSLTLDLMKMGGDGVVSVASNIVPDKIAEMVEYALMENMEEAEKINERLGQLFEDLFIVTNPIPVKYMAHKMGICELAYRLPMCPPNEKAQDTLNETLRTYNLISE